MKEDEKENGGLLALPNETRGIGKIALLKQEQMPVRGVLSARKKKNKGAKDARMGAFERRKERESKEGRQGCRSFCSVELGEEACRVVGVQWLIA